MKIKVVLERGEDGCYAASCPALRSCWSQGKTREEALENIREAIELFQESSVVPPLNLDARHSNAKIVQASAIPERNSNALLGL